MVRYRIKFQVEALQSRESEEGPSDISDFPFSGRTILLCLCAYLSVWVVALSPIGDALASWLTGG